MHLFLKIKLHREQNFKVYMTPFKETRKVEIFFLQKNKGISLHSQGRPGSESCLWKGAVKTAKPLRRMKDGITEHLSSQDFKHPLSSACTKLCDSRKRATQPGAATGLKAWRFSNTLWDLTNGDNPASLTHQMTPWRALRVWNRIKLVLCYQNINEVLEGNISSMIINVVFLTWWGMDKNSYPLDLGAALAEFFPFSRE